MIFGQELVQSQKNETKRSKKLSFVGIALLSLAALVWQTPLLATIAAGNATSFLLTIEGKSDSITVEANKAFSITVRALDNSISTADTYLGTVAFTSTDTQARLPANYTFTASDRGQKTFSLAATLLSAGAHTITVTDTANSALQGEISITVTAGTTNQTGSTGTSTATKPTITTPSADSTVNEAQLDITGTTTPDTQVSIFDGTQLLSTVNSDRNGRFAYTTDTLTDGTHTIKVQITSSQGQTVESNPVQVRVDTSPPVLQSVIVNPLEVAGTERVTITVITEPDLNTIKATADQRSISLAPVASQSGSYSGQFIAPQTPGLYPVDIDVTDKFNNTTKYRAQATIKVTAPTVVAPTPTPVNQAPTVSVRANVQVGKAPLTVNFFSEARDSDGRIASYLWNFGDGTTSTEANPTHVYNEEGNYTVNLTVTDDKGLTATTTLQGKDISQSTGVAVSRTGPMLWIAIAFAGALSVILQRKKFFR